MNRQLNWRARATLLASTFLLSAASLLAAPAARANISDDFARADSADLGNGWIEKRPAAFSIAGQGVAKLASGSGYRDSIAYRPASEDVADVEASVELRLLAARPGYPQLHTRVQSPTVALSNWLDSYVLYIPDNASQAILGRQLGNSFVTTLATMSLAPALNTTDTYRLRLRTVGATPVQLNAYVERWNGTAWQLIGQASYADSSGQQIVSPGSVGFSGYVETAYRYDNFVRTNLSGPGNPVPVVTGLSPSSAMAGESGLTLTVNGSGFVGSSVVYWNGSPRATTYVSGSVLEASISAADLATAGSANVTVVSPAPGGGASSPQVFTIEAQVVPNPVPVASSLNPASATAGAAAFTLVVNGSGFASSASVRWNGVARTTTFISPTELRAAIGAADVAAAGTASVTVSNPAPGGGVSDALTFTIDAPPPPNPVPTASALAPSSQTAGGGAFTLTVTGSDFVSGAVVRWNGANRSTTVVSSTTLTAAIGAADVQAAGTAQVTVFNPAPGGGTSAQVPFTITPAGGGGGGGLSITSLSPVSATIGSPSVQVTVNGAGFTTASVVRWNGANRPTTFVSATQLRASLPGSDLAAEAIGAITVANGTTVSEPLSFFALSASDSVFFDGFNRGPAADIGNGWIEKQPSFFELTADGRLFAPTTPLEFHDAIVYRPFTEQQLDAEVGVEFVKRADGRFPQLHSRVQSATITQPDTLESYILYVESGIADGLSFAVQPPVYNVGECILLIVPFETLPQEGQRYRMRLQVRGTYPVMLTGIMEWFDGDSWELFVSGTVTHDANSTDPGWYCPHPSVPQTISSAGSFGLAKWYNPTEYYDNFHWRTLGGGQPVDNLPLVSSMTPGSVTAGAAPFTLTVNGSSFSTGTTVRWNGSDRPTTYVSPTQLRAAITSADVAAAGTATVSAFTPGTGGGASPTSLTFTINPPLGSGLVFSDSFERANAADIGNGWTEKRPNAFAIEAGRARKQANGSGYRDNIVYRPGSESLLDTEVSAEMRLFSTNVGYPQLLARVQTTTVATSNLLDAYMVYFNNNGSQAILGRQTGGSFVTSLATLNLTAPLNTTDTYRLRLRATGTATVQLQAFVDRLDGQSWTVIGQATANDSSAQRIVAPGVAGFGGYTENSYAFDNFSVFNLAP